MAHFLLRMTQPRFVVPGSTVMITRRTLRRHHLFRPDPAIRRLYLYTLALCAGQFGVLVHAVTLMSTREHLIVTDTKGRLPDFLRRLHRLVSLGTKVVRKWEGPTWDHEQASVVRLLTEQAIIEFRTASEPQPDLRGRAGTEEGVLQGRGGATGVVARN